MRITHVSVQIKLLIENNLIIQEKNLNQKRDLNFGPPDLYSLELYHLSYPGSHANSCSDLPLETDATLERHCGHDTICHLLTTSELLRHLNVNMIFKSNY